MIDELDTLGALRADLAEFYSGLNIDDVWAGKVDPWHVIVLTEQLARNPHSRVFAARGGTDDLQGWDQQTIVLARMHNLIAGLVSGLSSGSNIDDMLIAYPAADQEERQPQTLAELMAGGMEFFAQ